MAIDKSNTGVPRSNGRETIRQPLLVGIIAAVRQFHLEPAIDGWRWKLRETRTVYASLFGLAIVCCGIGVFGCGLNLGSWVVGATGTQADAVVGEEFRLADFSEKPHDHVARFTSAWHVRAGVVRDFFDLRAATLWVHSQTTHSSGRRIGLSENWMQCVLGMVYEPLSHTQNAIRLMRGGATDCSERCQILKTFCESAGLRCRFAGLEGHVVLEVRWRGRWHTADPDYGVVFATSVTELASPKFASLVIDRLSERGYTQSTVREYLAILQSTENNRVLPEGTDLSPRLMWIERFCNWAAWLLPMILATLGCLLVRTLHRLRPLGLNGGSAGDKSRLGILRRFVQ